MIINKTKKSILGIIVWLDSETSIKTDLSRNKHLIQYWKDVWKRAIDNSKTELEKATCQMYYDALSYKMIKSYTWETMKKIVRSTCIR